MTTKNKNYLIIFFGVLLFAVGILIHLSKGSSKVPTSLEHSNSFNHVEDEENSDRLRNLIAEQESYRLMSAYESNALMKRQEDECGTHFRAFRDEQWKATLPL